MVDVSINRYHKVLTNAVRIAVQLENKEKKANLSYWRLVLFFYSGYYILPKLIKRRYISQLSLKRLKQR